MTATGKANSGRHPDKAARAWPRLLSYGRHAAQAENIRPDKRRSIILPNEETSKNIWLMEGIMTYKSKAHMHGFGLTAKTQSPQKAEGASSAKQANR